MESIELLPNLTHCIETVAREEFWDFVNQYMESGQTDRKPEEKIELLSAFLESADFRRLRSQSKKHLVAGKQVWFVISCKEDRVSYEMVVTTAWAG